MAGQRTPRQTAAVQLGQELPQMMAAQLFQRNCSRKGEQLFQIAAVGGDRMGRLAPLLGQFGQIFSDGCFGRHDRGTASRGPATRARAAETSSPRRSR